MADKRALRILLDTYWSSKGWKAASKHNWAPETPVEDLAYAIRAGVMFPPRRMGHDELVDRIFKLRSQISPIDVGDAFAASLTSRNVAFRSALGSYSVILRMPAHSYRSARGSLRCEICGFYEHDAGKDQDVNVLNFERHKWGGVRHEQPFYAAFDLERFVCEPRVHSSAADRELLNSVLHCAESIPVGAKLTDLLAAVKPVVPGNMAERRNVIGILGFSGVLQIPGYSGFFREFTPAANRTDTPWYKDDWPYPIRWWRAGNGLDNEAISFWFGE